MRECVTVSPTSATYPFVWVMNFELWQGYRLAGARLIWLGQKGLSARVLSVRMTLGLKGEGRECERMSDVCYRKCLAKIQLSLINIISP